MPGSQRKIRCQFVEPGHQGGGSTTCRIADRGIELVGGRLHSADQLPRIGKQGSDLAGSL